MLAKITASDLPQDVIAAELLIERHKEHKVEIDGRKPTFQEFYNTGSKLISEGHILKSEIQNKIKLLKLRFQLLEETWEKRSIIYDQNLDVQLFKREANTLENWIVVREETLADAKLGNTIMEVEDIIKKHEDFEHTIKAQEDKFEALKRVTLLEEAFNMQKENERKAKLDVQLIKM